MTVDQLPGATVLCPHCDRVLKIVAALEPVRDFEGRDLDGDGSTGWIVLLSDGQTARFWLTGPRSR